MMATTTVLDDDQAYDHAGQPIAPLSPTGLPYRYKLRGHGLSSYASTAEEVLALVIEDYPQRPATTDADADVDADKLSRYEEEAHDLRVLHAFGVITTLVADAIISGDLSVDEEAVLQRSAERGPDRPPITADECPSWDHPTVPMVLLTVLYDRSLGQRTPPTGNVVFIDPGVPEIYLSDLQRLGVIQLSRNPAYRPGRLTEIIAPDQKPLT